MSVTNSSEGVIWGDHISCKYQIEAKNYVDQKVFDINYSLPVVTLLSTFKEHGRVFSLFFLVQAIFLYLAFKLLSRIHKKHSEVLVQIEHINSLNEANESMLKFTRTMNHNLKSPLGALKTLYALISNKLNLEERELLESIQINIDSLTERLGNEQKTVLETNPINISDVLKSTIAIKKLEMKGKDNIFIDSEIEPDLWAMANQVELTSILSNLINNSLEAKSDNVLHIMIKAKTNTNFLQIEVTDNGTGIEENILNDIFNYGMTTKISGKGCGLYHAKEIISSWSGNIKIESRKGQFTKVVVSLPKHSVCFKKEIILIDDEPLNILSWKGMANKYNVAFRGYRSSIEFFQDRPQYHEDLEIFVDYELGEENGVEVINRLQQEGYLNVSLATGEGRTIVSGINQVGKEFPIIQGLET